MKLLQIHTIEPERDRTGHTCVGKFDFELDDDVRLYKLRLLRMRNGKYRISAPFVGQNLAATFSPDLAERMTRMALEAIGVPANDR